MAIREELVDLPDVRVTAGQPFGIYVHVPFCVTRCGYCDFNTYTPAELGASIQTPGWVRCGPNWNWRPRDWKRRR